ncbi:HotDog domain-containing protein [Lasiosphaeria hispida]|uniref:HotDog domain-containing protein n=1 Tax=Lasiosphaeria hispida TaxID=260671 RepID=A0AAJ0ME25_9PEZI|nr:HotDog domain-containing protein [Lasiosphaeria hispida]
MAAQATTASPAIGPAAKPHTAPGEHNQFIKEPVAHFKATPWCAALLADPAVIDTIVVDRRPLATGESEFVRRVMNGPTTVRACVTFFRMVEPHRSSEAGKVVVAGRELSKSKALLMGGGEMDGEDRGNPFLLFNALLELGEDLCSFQGTLHGGLFAVLMDEVMGTAANFQSQHGAYTVQFNTNFHRAVKTPQVVLVRGRVVKKDKRKIFVKGTIEDKDGNLMAEGDGVWLQMGSNVGRSQL